MSLNPFKEKGIPIEKQVKTWSELETRPYDPKTVHPYTRARGILMNGIEVEGALFYHNFHRQARDMELRRQLSLVRRIEQQQQKMINWMIPASETALEVTIGYEQLAVDLTASMAKNEPDPYVKAALDFALLEDFDHLYRFANLMLESDPKKAEDIVKDLTEVMPGRPTVVEHRHPFDDVRRFTDRKKADPLTLMHVCTIIAAEQQTMNYYMNIGNRSESRIGRGLYQEIAMIEEQHVTHYGSLEDPTASLFEMAVCHEYNECYMYYSNMESESDERVKKIWQQMLEQEMTHLQMARDTMMKFEKQDPAEMYPKSFPEPTILEPSKEYVREVIEDQFTLTADGTEFVTPEESKNRDRFLEYQKKLNDGMAPSQEVIIDTIKRKGIDYRLETEGEHPIEILRDRKRVPSPEDLIGVMIS